MNLALLLMMLAAPFFPSAAHINVYFRNEGPSGIFGVSCDSRLFGDVEGNADALCAGIPDGSILLYPDEIHAAAVHDGVPERDLFVNILRHESAHLELGADKDNPDIWLRFRHPEVIRTACVYQYVADQCVGAKEMYR